MVRMVPTVPMASCADDVVEIIWRAGARANLATEWVAAAVAGGAFAVLEPPTSASAWVHRLLGDARMFADRVATLPCLQLPEQELVCPRRAHTSPPTPPPPSSPLACGNVHSRHGKETASTC